MSEIKMNKELYLVSGKVEWYINSFRTIDELINDFSMYKSINYQLGISMINLILINLGSRFDYFSRVISIRYYPGYLRIETDKGVFGLFTSEWRDPNKNEYDLEIPILIRDEKEIMIYSVANWIKQLMK